jgi:hypothetical protein
VPRLQAVGPAELSRAYHRIDDRNESVRVVVVTLDPARGGDGGNSPIDPECDVEWDIPAVGTPPDRRTPYGAGDDDPDAPFAGMTADELRGVFVRDVQDPGVADDVLDHLVRIGEPVNFVVVVDGCDGDCARLVAHAAVQKAERRLSEGAMHPSGRVFLEQLKREMRVDGLGYARFPTRPRLRELLRRTKRAGTATTERSIVRGFVAKHISEF